MPAVTVRRRVLHVHPERPDVLVERIDGEPPVFHHVCVRHQYAAPYVTDLRDIGCCPACVTEVEAPIGRGRYAALQAADVRLEGWR